MTANLNDPIFRDEAKAREWLEARVWPNAVVRPSAALDGAKRRS
jgi:hypothetical protein